MTYAAHWGSSLIFVQKFNFVKNWILNFHDKNHIENSLISVFRVQNFLQFYLNLWTKKIDLVCCKTYFNRFNLLKIMCENLSKATVWQKGTTRWPPYKPKKEQNHKLIYFSPFLFAKIFFFSSRPSMHRPRDKRRVLGLFTDFAQNAMIAIKIG